MSRQKWKLRHAPVTTNDKSLTQLMQPTLAQVNGEDKLHVLDNNASASEDFAYYGQLMPSLFVFVGATPADQDMTKAAPNHNPLFIVDNATLKTGVESHVRFILDYPKSCRTGTGRLEKDASCEKIKYIF